MEMDGKWTLGTIILMFVLAYTGWIAAFVCTMFYLAPFLLTWMAVQDVQVERRRDSNDRTTYQEPEN